MTLKTPLLIPSFSSKGFLFERDDQGVVKSEAGFLFETAKQFLTDSVLVSAFDIHYGFVSHVTEAKPDLFVVDSGGYETSDVQDLSATRFESKNSLAWTPAMCREILSGWPDGVPAMMVSFDTPEERLSLADQIAGAREFFEPVARKHLTTFLAKPESTDAPFVDVEAIMAQAKALMDFDVIGVTEKELGDSISDRMFNLARLRMGLDQRGNRRPIHVFGSLDPISVPLFFVSGAEIFDGLTWLRYGYHAGMAVYNQNFATARGELTENEDLRQARRMVHNLGELTETTRHLRRFLLDGSFEKLEFNGKILARAFELLMTRFEGWNYGR